jgi:mRNA interferase MazF
MNVPKRGDLMWLDFDPQSGREQAGRRPALVLTPAAYNRRSGLAFFCPITSHSKGYPFEVVLPPGLPVEGVILSDHIRSLDWQARHAKFIGVAPAEIMDEVMAKIQVLIRGED